MSRGDSVGTLVGDVACERQSPQGLRREHLGLQNSQRKDSLSTAFQCVGFDCDSPGNEQGLQSRWLTV